MNDSIDDNRSCAKRQVMQNVKYLIYISMELDRIQQSHMAFVTANDPFPSRPRKPVNSPCGCGTDDVTSSTKQRIFAATTGLTDTEREARWARVIQSAQRARHQLRKATRMSREILKTLTSAGMATDMQEAQHAFAVLKASSEIQLRLTEAISRKGLDRTLVANVISYLLKTDALPDLSCAVRNLGKLSDAYSKHVALRMLNASTTEAQIATVTSGLEAAAGVPLCAAIPGVGTLACVTASLILVFGGVLILLGTGVAEIFNDTDDDNARVFINSSSCDTLGSLSAGQLRSLIQAIINGPTGDDDERAILKLLNCLGCNQVRAVIGRFDRLGVSIMDEFHGDEFDLLMLRVRECGVVSFAEWDDETTRLFINTASCGTLNALRLSDIRTLMLNLFSGATDDDDENAIVHLIECLPCSKRRALTELSDMSYDDFDDEVDGEEWDRLEQLFRNCGITEPD